MTSQLWNHLAAGTDDQAVHLYLVERDERGNPRHASLYDLGDYGEERLAERATAIEAGRDFVEELAVRA